MREYAFAPVRLTGMMLTVKLSDHRELIHQYAKVGYRYHGFIPTEIGAHGQLLAIDLIFEKDV